MDRHLASRIVGCAATVLLCLTTISAGCRGLASWETYRDRGDRLEDDPAAQVHAYLTATDLAPADPAVYYELAMRLLGHGHAAAALKVFDLTLQLEPEHIGARHYRGVALSDPARALAQFDAVIALAPDRARSRMRRAMALTDLGRTADARAAFETALRADPDDGEIRFRHGQFLARLGEHDAALDAYAGALEQRADHRGAHRGRGRSLHALGRYEQALEAYDRALRYGTYGGPVRPEHALHNAAHVDRARTLVALDRRAEALAALDGFLAVRPDHEEAADLRLRIAAEIERDSDN